MKHLSILVPEGDVSITNIEGTHQIFTHINDYLVRSGKEKLFRIQLVGLRKDSRIKNGLFSIHSEVLLDEVEKTDLIIIPALQSNIPTALQKNAEFIPWLVEQHSKGAAIASLCLGSFLLAAT